MVIPVAHDFICPWCWIGMSQARRLRAELGVQFEWRGFELYPEGMAWPPPSIAETSNRPPTPSRYDLALAAEGLGPVKGPLGMRTFRAHQALEYAKKKGVGQEYLERLYDGYWKQGLRINDLPVLKFLATGLMDDLDELELAVAEQRFRSEVVVFDDPAYAAGVYNVPTFWINEERYAEQPYSVLKQAVIEALGDSGATCVYAGLDFNIPKDRPFVFINMATTMDGKIITGERDEPVMDLGSKADHATMRYLESCADAVMIGAGTLRATPNIRFDDRLLRIVVTRSGDLDQSHAFFKAPRVVTLGPNDTTDWPQTLSMLKEKYGVGRLLCEGGSELNASLFRAGVVDEVFVTQTAKLKLGKDAPTIAGGEAFPRNEVEPWKIVSTKLVGDEVFLRYRR